MYKTISIPAIHISSYHAAFASGIFWGLILFFITERYAAFPNQPSWSGRVKIFLCYVLTVALCLQGACWFHYLFDIVRPRERAAIHSILDIIFTHPFKTERVLYGAIYLFPAGMFLSALIMKRRFLNQLDIKTPVLFSVLGFARVGCFLNGCCFGIISKTFGMVFPSGSVAAVQHHKRGLTQGNFLYPAPSLPVIPTQLISMIVIFGLLFFSFLEIRKKRKYIFWRYLSYYAIFRFLIEFIRDDYTRAYFYGLSASQWLSAFILVPSILLFLFKKEMFIRILKG